MLIMQVAWPLATASCEPCAVKVTRPSVVPFGSPRNQTDDTEKVSRGCQTCGAQDSRRKWLGCPPHTRVTVSLLLGGFVWENVVGPGPSTGSLHLHSRITISDVWWQSLPEVPITVDVTLREDSYYEWHSQTPRRFGGCRYRLSWRVHALGVCSRCSTETSGIS